MENKILIDSSCWIDFLRQSDPDLSHQMASLLRRKQAVLCGPIHFEIVGGARTSAESEKISSLLGELDYLILNNQDFHEAALLRQKLLKKGLTINGMDLIIAHLAIKNDCLLLHKDHDFNQMARHCKDLQIHPFSLKK